MSKKTYHVRRKMRLRPQQHFLFDFPNHPLAVVGDVLLLERHLAASGKVLGKLDGEDTAIILCLHWDVFSMMQGPV